ncbi:MAG: hypothetical protein RDV48_16030 [Candidatus Eremiobacteraeota bacterium]|nr:hypothetical protein [Candidatus Eremiobacteraeota bacterium]
MIRDVSQNFQDRAKPIESPRKEAAKEGEPAEPQDSILICDGKALGEAAGQAGTAVSTAAPTRLQRLGTAISEKAHSHAEFLDEHKVLNDSLATMETIAKGIKAFPKFIYPSFYKMTSQEAGFVMNTLDKLPLKDVNSVTRMEILPDLQDAAGLAYRSPADPLIQLSRSQMDLSPHWAETVTIHETGHTKDYGTALFGLFGHESSKSPLWGKPPYISDYAKTNHWEDFAETYANYHLHPETLKEQCPEKYARMEELEKLGTFDKLIDQKAFRETGKYIGQKLGGIPYLRTGVSLLSYMIGFMQIIKGVGELEQAHKSGDVQKKMDGTLNIAAGACFASKLFCVAGLAVDGAKQALDRAITKGEITAEQGNAVVQSTVGAIGGPLAAIGNWIREKIFHHAPHQGEAPQQKPPQEGKDITIGTLAKAASIGIGGAAGSLAGGIVGPYLGVMAGFSVGGPLGGVIGLLAGTMVGVYTGNRAGGDIGGLIGDLMVSHKAAREAPSPG